MQFENILCKTENGVFYITINRESKMNALNIQTLQEIKVAVLSVQKDPEVRIILLTGAGQRAFAAGADIAEFASFGVAEGTQMAADGHSVMNTIESSVKPVIAAVNGFALGGGCELAMACHIRVASDNARFGQPEVNLGIIPGYGGTQRLAQIVGKGKALELLMTGDAIKAEEALHLGLVSAVTSQDQLLSKCLEIATKIQAKGPLSIARIIQTVNAHYNHPEGGFQLEINEFGNSFGTEDFKEGTEAFLNKRSASFSGK